MRFCVLPAGAWGTAMAIHLKRRGHSTTLVPREPEETDAILRDGENKQFFPGYPTTGLTVTSDRAAALREADVVILACPSKFLRAVCGEILEDLDGAEPPRLTVTLCKGLETGTNLLPGSVMDEALPGWLVASLSGPTFAGAVGAGQPTAIVLAANRDDPYVAEVQAAMSDKCMRVYTSTDRKGVELGGALKNIYAIAAGVVDGLGLGDNARAALVTRALAEMVRVGVELGGKVETFYGLSGVGDLILTCNGAWSRNHTFGEEFARGTSIDTLINERRMTVEGYRTADCVHHICLERGIEAPLLNEIYAVLYENKPLEKAVPALMQRELKAEG